MICVVPVAPCAPTLTRSQGGCDKRVLVKLHIDASVSKLPETRSIGVSNFSVGFVLDTCSALFSEPCGEISCLPLKFQ